MVHQAQSVGDQLLDLVLGVVADLENDVVPQDQDLADSELVQRPGTRFFQSVRCWRR